MGALCSLSDRKNINQDTVSIIRASCEQIAQAVVEQSKAWHIRADDSQEMLNEIRGKKIYLKFPLDKLEFCVIILRTKK